MKEKPEAKQGTRNETVRRFISLMGISGSEIDTLLQFFRGESFFWILRSYVGGGAVLQVDHVVHSLCLYSRFYLSQRAQILWEIVWSQNTNTIKNISLNNWSHIGHRNDYVFSAYLQEDIPQNCYHKTADCKLCYNLKYMKLNYKMVRM